MSLNSNGNTFNHPWSANCCFGRAANESSITDLISFPDKNQKFKCLILTVFRGIFQNFMKML